MSRDFEVIVAGGGPGGTAAALVLTRLGRRVLLLEAGGRGGTFRVGEAIPPAVTPLLRDLGLLGRFRADGHRPCYGNVSAWGGEPSESDFLFDPNGHGWHLDRARFNETLRVATRDAGAEWRPARLARVDRGAEGWRVTLASTEGGTEELECGWLIDSTGRQSAVARRLGATRLRDDNLVAFHARYRAAMAGSDVDSRTAVEAAPDGWWYTALVPSGERVVVYLTDADLVDRDLLLSTDRFVERLAASRYIGGLLAAHGYNMTAAPRGADAGTARLDRVVGPGWVAVGDAALSFDPLSSQGILTALFTGMRAGQAIDLALAGNLTKLDGYARRLDEIDRVYRRHRNIYYAAEARWPDRAFWRRRHQYHLSSTDADS
jgi:flavin-dependent dehydrogenase